MAMAPSETLQRLRWKKTKRIGHRVWEYSWIDPAVQNIGRPEPGLGSFRPGWGVPGC